RHGVLLCWAHQSPMNHTQRMHPAKFPANLELHRTLVEQAIQLCLACRISLSCRSLPFLSSWCSSSFITKCSWPTFGRAILRVFTCGRERLVAYLTLALKQWVVLAGAEFPTQELANPGNSGINSIARRPTGDGERPDPPRAPDGPGLPTSNMISSPPPSP